MAAVLPSRIADRRAIAPQCLADDVGGSQPPALLPSRAGLTRIFPRLSGLASDRRALDRNRSRITTHAPIVAGRHCLIFEIRMDCCALEHTRQNRLGSQTRRSGHSLPRERWGRAQKNEGRPVGLGSLDKRLGAVMSGISPLRVRPVDPDHQALHRPRENFGGRSHAVARIGRQKAPGVVITAG